MYSVTICQIIFDLEDYVEKSLNQILQHSDLYNLGDIQLLQKKKKKKRSYMQT